MQFTEPTIDDVAGEIVAAGVRRVVALPLYPLCGASTTIAALDSLHEALVRRGGDSIEIVDVTGWHAHPGFIDAVSEATEGALSRAGASLDDPGTLLYFSAHGTPLKYLEEGSRYDTYVEEACALVAARIGVDRYVIGYQNHSNRGVPWTSPSNEDLLPELDATCIVVVPISFIHEQSETLVELDEDLMELAAGLGKRLVRVPVPHDAASLTAALADLVEPFLDTGQAGPAAAASPAPSAPTLVRCVCRPEPGSFCLNGARLD
jgi:ferrochelatase